MKYEVYKITNSKNKKNYIGITTQGWKNRCGKHKSDSRLGCDFKLHRAMRKYGVENFEFALLETCKDVEEMKEREAFWIDLLKTMDDNFGYNMTSGGDGTFGRMHSEESKKKMSESALDRDSMSNVYIEVKSLICDDTYSFKTMRSASEFLNINENTLGARLRVGGNKSNVDDFLVKRRDDLKTKPKPKSTKRDPKQIADHMKVMQEKSKETRAKDPEKFKQTARKARLDAGHTKIIQQFKDNELIAEYNGSREAVELNEGFNRSGLQHNLKGRTKSYKGFVFKFKQD